MQLPHTRIIYTSACWSWKPTSCFSVSSYVQRAADITVVYISCRMMYNLQTESTHAACVGDTGDTTVIVLQHRWRSSSVWHSQDNGYIVTDSGHYREFNSHWLLAHLLQTQFTDPPLLLAEIQPHLLLQQRGNWLVQVHQGLCEYIRFVLQSIDFTQ